MKKKKIWLFTLLIIILISLFISFRIFDARNPQSYIGMTEKAAVARAEKYITDYTQTLNKLGYRVTAEFPKGTIVMTIAANIGDVAILGFNACFPDSVVGFYPKKGILNDFLYYALKVKRNDFLQSAVINTQLNLNVERVSSVFIDIPALTEQEKIVVEIEEKEKIVKIAISKAQKEIAAIKEYREALITDLVTGKRCIPQT